MKQKDLFVVLVIWVAILPFLGFAQELQTPTGLKQVQIPETIEEGKGIGTGLLQQVPKKIGEIWTNEVLPVWKKFFGWLKKMWDNTISQWTENIWQMIKGITKEKIEEQRPRIEKELEKEKQELKEDIKTYSKSAGKDLWERFLGLFSDE